MAESEYWRQVAISHYGRLRSFAKWKGIHTSDADSVAQSTLANMWQKYGPQTFSETELLQIMFGEVQKVIHEHSGNKKMHLRGTTRIVP